MSDVTHSGHKEEAKPGGKKRTEMTTENTHSGSGKSNSLIVLNVVVKHGENKIYIYVYIYVNVCMML